MHPPSIHSSPPFPFNQNSDAILAGADVDDVAFCVVGDPYGATTHADLALRARAAGVPIRVIHNASILNAAGAAGLSLYRYGETVSLVFFMDAWRPDSFYARVAANRARGLHTLLLLDIKVKEPTDESLARGKPVYLPPRYMTAFTAAAQLLEVEAARREGAYGRDTVAIAVARVGAPDGVVLAATLGELADGVVPEAAVGGPLHSLILPGDMHEVEAAAVDAVRWRG